MILYASTPETHAARVRGATHHCITFQTANKYHAKIREKVSKQKKVSNESTPIYKAAFPTRREALGGQERSTKHNSLEVKGWA